MKRTSISTTTVTMAATIKYHRNSNAAPRTRTTGGIRGTGSRVWNKASAFIHVQSCVVRVKPKQKAERRAFILHPSYFILLLSASLTEDRRADPHERRTLLDGRLEVVA